VRAFLLGFLAAMILGAGAPPVASAARKRDTQNRKTSVQDSVLWIPRVSRPPDFGTIVEGIEQSDRRRGRDRGSKVQHDPDRSKSENSGPDAAKEEKLAKPRPVTPFKTDSTGSDTAPEEALSKPRPDSLIRFSRLDSSAPKSAPQVSSPERSQPQGPASQDSSRTDSSFTRTKTTTAPGRNPAAIESSSLDSSQVAWVVGAPPPPAQEPAAQRPPAQEPPAQEPPAIGPDGPPSPPPPSARDLADEDLVFWVCAAGAAILIVWTGIGWFRARKGRSARDDPDELSEEAAGRRSRNGEVDGAEGEAARNGRRRSAENSPAMLPANVAVAHAPRGRSRVRQMFLSNLWRVRGSLLLAALFMVGGAAVELLKPWPLKVILDHVILAKPLSDALSFLQGIAPNGFYLLLASAAAIVVISVVGGVFSYFEVFITKAIGYRMVYALRREVFSHLQRLSLSFHNRTQSGDLLTTFGKDTNTLKDIFAESLLKFADHSLSVTGMLAIMWFINWKTCLIAMASLPFLCFTLIYLYRQTKLSLKRQRKQEGRVVSRVNEVLGAVSVVQAFGRERHEEERYEAVSNETLRESIRMTRLEAAASRSTHIMTAVGSASVVLFGGMEVLQGRMLPGELVLVMSYLSGIYKPLRGLSKLSIECSKAAASAERIGEVLQIEPEIQDLPDAIEADHIRGEILFAAVSFDYGDGKDVLRDVSFQVTPGQRVALIGVSGAGKSTIASLILRLYEAHQGVILIDGVDITRYRRESLRRQIGIVLQDSVLFGATIRENIAYGRPDASMEEVVAAARTANADEFVRDLESGYDSVVGERGVTLSAGQRQRIAIARAVIRNPRILILDEPMTGLDAESETKVREALDRLMAGRTSIIITHDLASIADAHQVLVLEDGRIAERGTDAELLNRNGRYRELFDLGLHPAAPQVVKPLVA